ncbi:unnamed protein product [Victoria cruziana]
MAMVTRSSRKLNEQEVSSRRSSGGWKEKQTITKGLEATMSASISPSSLRRSPRVTCSKNSSASSPSSWIKSKKADISKSPVASTVGTKRKSREENQDSPLPPRKCAFRPSEKETTRKSPEARTGDRQDKKAKKPNANGSSDTGKFEKNKEIKKPVKKQPPSSSVKQKSEDDKAGKLPASLNTEKSDEGKVNKSPGSSNKKKPEVGKTNKLPSTLKIKTSEEGKRAKSSGKSVESNGSKGSSSGDSSKDEKQEDMVVHELRSSKKREDKEGGGAAKISSCRKLGTTSKRLDARHYRELFALKPEEQKKDGIAGQSSRMIKDGCSETIASDKVENVNVGHDNMDDGDSYVKGDAENEDFCRLRSGKSIVKSIAATENSLQKDGESAELEAAIHIAEGDPNTSVGDESYLLSKHQKGYVSNSQEVRDFSQSPYASRNQGSKTDNLSDDELPQIDSQMAFPCENGRIPSTGTTGSPGRNSLDREAHYDGTSRVDEKSADSCTSKEGQVVVGCDHDTSVGTKEKFCTLDVSKDDKTPSLLSGNKRDRCEETLESSDVGNSVCGMESSKRSRLDDTPVAAEDTEKLQMVREGGAVDSTNNSVLQSSKMEQSKDTEYHTCGVCELGGELLCCDGKGCTRAYHLSCLDPPLADTPPGSWHCLWCVKRKLEFGLHLVSEGVESIWAVRGNENSTDDGSVSTQRKVEKEYFVKYRGLAHVHNRWIPERELLADAPKILTKFNSKYQKNKAPKWKSEWTEPERLLKKRLLMPPQVAEEYFRNNTKFVCCNGEWLVKWKGLGYEFCTWEMENESFLTSSKAMSLVKDFETRREKAKQASSPSRANMVNSETYTHIKMQSLSHEQLPAQGMEFINKLYEYWQRGHNAVIIDDQERIARATLFISLLVSSVSRPFLILSPSSAFSAWEAEIMRVDPHIDLVVYNGNKNVRDMIRGLEFYEESGCVMFQVLLSTLDAAAEDTEFLECIGWESIIFDQCHGLKTKLFKKIGRLNTDFRLLLFNEQIKESISEYLNIFSLLGPKDDCSCIGSKQDDDNGKELSVLKQRLSSYVIYEHKSDSSKFAEHWTPVFLSNAQLEQYCSILVSNSRSLKLKNDSLNPLSNILLSLKKCCDHPYLVDESLQNSLTAGFLQSELLDIGVRASGKLMLLDKILSEVRNRGLRVLILFQFIGGSVPHSIGDILDDYLRQRFGENSYERVDSGLAVSKKQLALNMFNDKGKERFIFLLENRACTPSIKLLSVDAVIIFGSDWSPSNDLKALQKVNIDFQTEQLPVFRLYIPHTLEEKIVGFYTEEVILDNKVDNLSPNVLHMLLMWGSSYLFKKFDELQDPKVQHSGSIFPDNERLLEGTFRDVVSLLPPVTNVQCMPKDSAISKMKPKVSFLSRPTLFSGESRPCFSDGDHPHIYWNKLLEGRVDVRSLTGLIGRPRRKVHCFVQSPTKLAENEDHTRKQKKAAGVSNVTSSSPGLQAEDMSGGEFTTRLETGPTPVIPSKDNVLETSSMNMVESEDGKDSGTTQQLLHDLLKPELLKLCTTLQLPKKVVDIAEVSLDYVMKKHQVPKEPESILQAFLMSLCWTSASMLKYDIDHEASVMLAKEQLQFKCEKGEVKSVYKKLRPFRPYLKTEMSGKIVDESSKDSHVNVDSNCTTHERLQELAGKTMPDLEGRQCIENEDPLLQGERPISEEVDLVVDHTNAFHKDGADQDKNTETRSLLHKLYSLKKKRTKYVIDKQKEEFAEFVKFNEMEFSKITMEYRACLFEIEKESDFSIKEDKRRILSQDFRDKKTSHNRRMKLYSENLADRQRKLRDSEAQTYSYWVEQAKAERSVEPYLLLQLPNIQFRKEDLETASQNLANEIAEKVSQNDSKNEGVTSEPLSNGLDNIPAISSGSAAATLGTSGTSIILPDDFSVFTTDSQANLEGQGTLIGSEAVKITSIFESACVLASTMQDNQADTVMKPVESMILAKNNHVTDVDSGPGSVHATMETDQIEAPGSPLQQKSGSTCQMADGLRTELGHEQVSSVVPGERSAPGGTRSDHENEVSGPDILSSSSAAVQVHVSTEDDERPRTAEVERDTGLDSLSQDTVSLWSLDAFLSLPREVQASSVRSDGGATSAETVRESDHGITDLEIFHEACAPVAEPLDVCPSSAKHVVEVSCIDSSQGSICAETVREGIGRLESPSVGCSPVQQLLGALPLSAQWVHSANPDERSASAETARAETAKEDDHGLGRSESPSHAGTSVQQPLGTIPLSAQEDQVSSASHVERSASAESARAETAREHDHGLGSLESPCRAGGPILQSIDALPFLSAEEVQIFHGNPDERSASVEPERPDRAREHDDGLGRLGTPCHAEGPTQQLVGTLPLSATAKEVQVASPDERPAGAETVRESEHAGAMSVSRPRLGVSLHQPQDASHSSAERVGHCPYAVPCPSVFVPTVLLPPMWGGLSTSANTRGRTTGSESGEQTLRSADPLYDALVAMYKEADQTKKWYEDEKTRLAAERDKVIAEVKRKYAEKLQDAKLKYTVTEEKLTKLKLNSYLAVSFRQVLRTGARKLVVQPGNCSTQSPLQQSGNGPNGAHGTDLISGDRNGPFVPLPSAGDLQVPCAGLDLRPVTPVASQPPPTNPAALVCLSDED